MPVYPQPMLVGKEEKYKGKDEVVWISFHILIYYMEWIQLSQVPHKFTHKELHAMYLTRSMSFLS